MSLCQYCQAIDFRSIGLRFTYERRPRFRDVEIQWSDLITNREVCNFCFQNFTQASTWLTKHLDNAQIVLGLVRCSQHRQTLTSESKVARNVDYCSLKTTFVLFCTSIHLEKGLEYTFDIYYHRSDGEDLQRRLDRTQALADTSRLKQLMREYESDKRTIKHWYSQIRSKMPSKSSSIFEKLHEDRNEHWISLGRTRSIMLDASIIKIWKETCLKYHNHTRTLGGEQSSQALAKLRLINVHTRCLVERRADERWVALSYVWGVDAVPTLTKATLNAFSIPGSFTIDTIPKTIFDAMTVTAQSGESYIWVDALCIVQDDAADKQKWIPCMDDIYARAIFTIIAASGTKADAGLPGLRKGSRSVEQSMFKVHDTSLVASVVETSIDSQTPSKESQWAERGWTMQEGLLPTRKLIFTGEKVVWQCQQATWCEETLRDLLFGWNLREPDDNDIRQSDRNSDVWTLTVQISVMEAYQSLVDIYSRRKLKYESDRIDAFQGILNALSKTYGLNTIWGLPKGYLDHGLTWKSASDTASSRRLDKCKYKVDDDTVECHFPSWSWSGWMCAVTNPATAYKVDNKVLWIVFHMIDKHGKVHVVGDVWDTGILKHHERMWTPTPAWFEDVCTDIPAEAFPTAVKEHNLWPIVLGFWTSVMVVKLRVNTTGVQPFRDSTDPHRLYENDSGSEIVVRELQLQDSSFRQGTVESIGLVLVRFSTNNFPYGIASALITDAISSSNGLLKRRGFVEMDGESWHSLQPKEWKMVFLS